MQIDAKLPKEKRIEIAADEIFSRFGYEKATLDGIIALADVGKGTVYKYFGNKNSKKFHKASCSALKNTKEENKVFYKTKDEFIKYNYSPCKMCNP